MNVGWHLNKDVKMQPFKKYSSCIPMSNSTLKWFIRSKIRAFAIALLVAISFCLGSEAHGANPTNGLRIELITAYNLVVDSNVESPSTYAPRAAFIGAKIHNDSTNVALTNVFVSVGNYTNNTPGTYPSRVHTNDLGQTNIFGPLPGSEVLYLMLLSQLHL